MPDDFTIENETLTPRQRSQRARRAAERERGAAAAAQVEGTLRKQVGLPEAEASVIEPAPPADPNSPTTPAEGPKERIDYADPPPAATSPRSSFEASEGQFSRDQQERRTAEMLQQIDEQTAQPVRTPPPAQAAAEGDPEGIRLGGFLQGVADPFRQVVGGARDAIQNSLTALDSFAAFMNENVADFSAFEWRTAETTADGSRGALKEVLPEVAAPTTVAGGITRGISQFVFGFIPLLKGLKMAAGTKTASSALLKFYQTEVAAGLATTLVFDPAEQNLSALIQEYPSLSNPVAEFLATNPDDSDAVNRLKTGVEGLLVGAGVEGAVAGAAFLKSLLPLRARRAQEGIVPREADEIKFSALGDPDAPMVDTGPTVPEPVYQDLENLVPVGVDPDEPFRTIDDFTDEDVNKVIHELERWVLDEVVLDEHGTPQILPNGTVKTVVKSDPSPELFEFVHAQQIPQDTVVYRGGDLRDGPRLMSTSPSLEVAEGFMKPGTPGGNIMSEIHIPAGASAANVADLLSNLRPVGDVTAVAQGEKEILLALGGDWELKYIGDTEIQLPNRTTPRKVAQYELVPSEGAAARKQARDENIAARKANDEIRANNERKQAENAAVAEAYMRAQSSADLKQAVDSWLNGEEGAKVPFKINWAKVSTTEDIEELVRSVSSSFSGTIDEARRGSISQQQTMEMADQLGMSVDDLINRKTGQAFNAEEVVASRMILESSANQLIEMGRRFQHSTDETEMFQLMRMMNIHVGIQAQFQGAASEAGRALRAYQIPKGSAANQILEIQQQLMAGGGPC